MVLDRVYLLPHGDEIIDQPDADSEEMHRVIRSVARGDRSDAVVIISPHGLRLSKNVSLINTERFHGVFELKTRRLDRMFRNYRPLTEQILNNAAEYTEEAGFITSSGEKSVFPMDFGALIPLDFFNDRPIVYAGQPRIFDIPFLEGFGRQLYHIIESHRAGISLIISADQAHTHSSSGPYGYSDKAAPYEETVIQCISSNNFDPLRQMDRNIIEGAKPDSYWNMIILAGLLSESKRRLEFDFHYVEEYFGMICAHSFPE